MPNWSFQASTYDTLLGTSGISTLGQSSYPNVPTIIHLCLKWSHTTFGLWCESPTSNEERWWKVQAFCPDPILRVMFFFTYWPKLFGDKNYLVRVVGERVLCRWIVSYELIIYWLQMRKWRWKGNALPFNSKQCQIVSNLFWYVYTLLKSVVLVWAMEVCYKESMLLGNRGNVDLFIRGLSLFRFYLLLFLYKILLIFSP